MQNIPAAALIATVVLPFFYLSVLTDYILARSGGRDYYDLNDTLASLGVALLNSSSGPIFALVRNVIYFALLNHVSLQQWAPTVAPTWSLDSPWAWMIGLLAYDFTYYWQHRMGHEVNILWSSHVIHHSSERFNLATALRVPSASMYLWTWIFATPLAISGMPMEIFSVATLLNLLYQFWIHTERIGSLGWFDRIFGSPSNHRVHHGINDRYIDKNYGGILMVWDHLFGTFEDERFDDPVRYGTRDPVRSWQPLWINLHTFCSLAKESFAARRWRDKLALWLHRPGWHPEATTPQPFNINQRERYITKITSATSTYCTIQMGFLPMQMVYLIATQASTSLTEKIVSAIYIGTSTIILGMLLSDKPTTVRLGHLLELLRLVVPALLAIKTGFWLLDIHLGTVGIAAVLLISGASLIANLKLMSPQPVFKKA